MFFVWKVRLSFPVYFVPLSGGLGGFYMHDAVPKVVRIAVSTVIMMLRIFPHVELLLKVPIV